MDDTKFAQLQAVNKEVNTIPYEALPAPGEPVDWWHDNPGEEGSFCCRDYVLLKSEKLRDLGWPESSLTVILCYVEPPGREYHAVLCAEADGEAWVLDSRADSPYRFENPSPNLYTWDRRQVPGTTEFESIA